MTRKEKIIKAKELLTGETDRDPKFFTVVVKNGETHYPAGYENKQPGDHTITINVKPSHHE
jgi:hypothetical protein